MNQNITQQEREKYTEFLDALRESSRTNMFGAAPYLKDEFPELWANDSLARQVLRDWMASHDKE